MKKYVLLLAALALIGCVHAQYKSDYLQQFAAYDCSALKLELLAAGEQESRIQVQRKALRKAIVFQSDRPPHNPSGDFFQAARMQLHARQQAALQLQASQGCASEDLLSSAHGTSNLRE